MFDERFGRGFYEDADLSERLAANYRLLIDAKTYVHHGGPEGCSASFFQQNPLKTIRLVGGNLFVYGKKHGALKAVKLLAGQMLSYLSPRHNISRMFTGKF